MKSSLYEGREQTEVKHQILERYLSAFAPIVGRSWKDIAYVDCLAGPWEAKGENLEDTSFARAIGVLRNAKFTLASQNKFPSFRCLLIENNATAFAQLRSFADRNKDIEVKSRKWDFGSHVPDVVAYAKERQDSFPFFFVDPTGWELVAIDLIRPILEVKPGEVLINLMTSWIKRFLADGSKLFERLVGPHVGRLRQLQGDEQEEELVRCYSEAIRNSGNFDYVCTLPVMKSGHDMFHFWMIYGTRSWKGVEVFKNTEKHVVDFMHETRAEAQQRQKVEQSQQFYLLPPEVTYSEKRFTRLRTKNLELARADLDLLLRQRKLVSFDDAWAKTMQYSLVKDTDLRDWIQQWEKSRDVEVIGMKERQKFPHLRDGIRLKWTKKS